MATVIGLSAYYHDSAVALVRDGRVVLAAQEERFTRRRHDAAFPASALAWIVAEAGLTAATVDAVVFHEKPLRKFDRITKTVLSHAPAGYPFFRGAMGAWLGQGKLFQHRDILANVRAALPGFDGGRLLFCDHHLSHAASAFYPSPFPSAAVLTVDGVGEWATTSLGVGDGTDLTLLKEIRFPHSLGLLYSAFTQYTGFRVNSGEYKVMGLAPYGRPLYAQAILDTLLDLKADGTFRLNMECFDYATGRSMINDAFCAAMGGPPRQPETPLTQRDMDMAASIQAVTEEVMLRLARTALAETGQRSLCLAGGVALNCVANGRLVREVEGLDALWIQPASGDAGGALGAALAAAHMHFGAGRPLAGGAPASDGMAGSLLGPSFSGDEAARRLQAAGCRFERHDEQSLIATVAGALAEGKVVGWMQGRAEYGPRALGARSILGDPRSPAMQKVLNLKVKFRESFRPFAPAVLREKVGEWFMRDGDSPYMLLVDHVRPDRRRAMTAEEEALFGIDKLNIVRSDVPAVTHVDYSARVQTVHADRNPRFHALLSRFDAETRCPVLVNTSFNVRGEPIVLTPEDAFACFMGTDLDLLVVEDCIARKEDQESALARDYSSAFSLD